MRRPPQEHKKRPLVRALLPRARLAKRVVLSQVLYMRCIGQVVLCLALHGNIVITGSCLAAERPAEDRRASAQKAADTRAERYGSEVTSFFWNTRYCTLWLCTGQTQHSQSCLSADPLRQRMRAAIATALPYCQYCYCLCSIGTTGVVIVAMLPLQVIAVYSM